MKRNWRDYFWAVMLGLFISALCFTLSWLLTSCAPAPQAPVTQTMEYDEGPPGPPTWFVDK